MRSVRSQKLLGLTAVALISVPAFAQDQKPGKPRAGYKVLLIEKATVEKNATTDEFPGDEVELLERSALANLQKKKTFEQVTFAVETANPQAARKSEVQKLTMTMTVIQFDKRNRASRYRVGFGAGATKIKVRFVFHSGKVQV